MKQSFKEFFPILFCALALFSLCSLCQPASAAGAARFEAAELPQSDADLVNPGGGSSGAVEGAPDKTPEAQINEGEAVAGARDETPSGMTIFWGIAIALLIAAAVIFGIVMMVPKEEEDR